MTTTQFFGFSGSLLFLGAAALLPATPQKGAAKKPANQTPAKKVVVTGEALYLNRCSGCHGKTGQGGSGYESPLVGTKMVPALSKFIHASMPPSGAKLSMEEATKVAAYVYDAFYSPIAQDRNRPARVALSRLTVRQFRNAVADLVGQSRPAIAFSKENGLRGEYFKARNFDQKSRVIERVDAEVNFDFGTEGPQQAEFDPNNFSAVWQGSVIAPETGEYEISANTDHAVRIWFNGWKKPFIDAWVKSGKDTEFKETVYLVGGRSYPIRMEFSKAVLGVSDADKKNKKRPLLPAFVNLQWKRPHLAAESIPQRFLITTSSAESMVVTTPFPADDRSIGYERGNSVSKAWDDATTNAAIEVTTKLVENLQTYTGIPPEAADRKDKMIAFAKRFAARAFRRPLTPEIEQTYISKQFDAASTPEIGLKRALLMTLKSPRFLYREIGSDTKDDYSIASDLSFGLWDTVPDQELTNAAAKGQLHTTEQISAQAERMVQDPRSWTKLREFLLGWLKVDETQELVKNAKNYPGFDSQAATDLRTSLELFLQNTAGSPTADYREMMQSKTQYLNGRLAKIYGVTLPEKSGFEKVELDPARRAGVLTHPYLLARFAYLDGSSPIHRGVLILRNLLGRKLPPPPAAVAPFAASLHPKFTTRERVALQTKPELCNSCHSVINPLGFTLERFDAIGRLRDKDNGKLVDTSGFYRDRGGKIVKFSGASELAKYLAESEDAQGAFVEKLFHSLVKQPILAYGPTAKTELEKSFENNQYSIKKLMVQIMVKAASYDPAQSTAKGNP